MLWGLPKRLNILVCYSVTTCTRLTTIHHIKGYIHSFNIRYGSMVCIKRLQRFRPPNCLNNFYLVFVRPRPSESAVNIREKGDPPPYSCAPLARSLLRSLFPAHFGGHRLRKVKVLSACTSEPHTGVCNICVLNGAGGLAKGHVHSSAKRHYPPHVRQCKYWMKNCIHCTFGRQENSKHVVIVLVVL